MDTNKRTEQWPDAADHSSVAGVDIYAYQYVAMISFPREDAHEPESRDLWRSPDDLRSLAYGLLWAADRLETRERMTTRTDIEKFKTHLRTYDHGRDASLAELSPIMLQRAVDGAKQWIGSRRWSWNIVAANYLRDGHYHA